MGLRLRCNQPQRSTSQNSLRVDNTHVHGVIRTIRTPQTLPGCQGHNNSVARNDQDQDRRMSTFLGNIPDHLAQLERLKICTGPRPKAVDRRSLADLLAYPLPTSWTG